MRRAVDLPHSYRNATARWGQKIALDELLPARNCGFDRPLLSETSRRGIDDRNAAGAHLLDFERAFGQTAATKAEGAVDPGKAVRIGESLHWEITAWFPLLRNAYRQQNRI